jgi:hypothetical protein
LKKKLLPNTHQPPGIVLGIWNGELGIVIPNPLYQTLFAPNGTDVAMQRLYTIPATAIKGAI